MRSLDALGDTFGWPCPAEDIFNTALSCLLFLYLFWDFCDGSKTLSFFPFSGWTRR